MKKLLVLLSLAVSFSLSAQIGISTPATQLGGGNSPWTFGGYAGVGGAFGGGGGTTVYITPRVGYKLTDNFEMGVAGNFSWSNSSYFSSTMLGIGPFANVYFGRSIYLSALFQEYFVNQTVKDYGYKSSFDEAALYLGGGYMQKLGDHVYMQLGAMYNVLYDKNKSVFGGGFVPQVGIVFGL